MLVAQAQSLNIPILSSDKILDRHGVKVCGKPTPNESSASPRSLHDSPLSLLIPAVSVAYVDHMDSFQ
jgi:hypothetical protein